MFTRSLVAAAVVLLASCGSVGPQPSPLPTAGPTPTPTAAPTMPPPTVEPTTPPRTPPPTDLPEPTITPTPSPTGGPIGVTLSPAEHPIEVRPAIEGERICFLVEVFDRYIDDGPITFSARGDGLTVESVPASVPAPGHVGELWVSIDPYEGLSERVATVELTVSHGGDEPMDWVETRSIIVAPDLADSRADIAPRYFNFWVDWLAAEHPELGIDSSTEWDAMFVSPLWIVSKYAYWSDEWEMVVTWHEMVAPDDFSEVHLRRRDTEVRYSLAFRQESVEGNSAPHQINPQEDLFR
jgi:hypothetical protein